MPAVLFEYQSDRRRGRTSRDLHRWPVARASLDGATPTGIEVRRHRRPDRVTLAEGRVHRLEPSSQEPSGELRRCEAKNYGGVHDRLTARLLHKAANGELRQGLPIGFVYDEAGLVTFDADAAVVESIATVFRRRQ